MDKVLQRKYALLKRAGLDVNYRKIANDKITSQILHLCDGYHSIGIYMSLQNEVATQIIVKHLLHQGKQVFVPKVEGSQLTFHQIMSLSDVVEGVFNVLEPKTSKCDINQIELMLVPLVAFDEYCQRIGYGKGYYDSVLCHTQALKVGIAFEIQRVNQVDSESHDVCLDCVITESYIYRKHSSSS